MKKSLSILFLFLLVFSTVFSASADGPWGEVFNPDGTVNYANLTDNGLVTQPASWMPSISTPFGTIGGQAEFHTYTTPSGNTVSLPSPMTLFFGSMYPSASGFDNSSSQFGTGAGFLTSALGLALGGGSITLSNGNTYVSPSQFADAMIAGQENIWSLPVLDVWNMLTLLARPAGEDMNLYLLAMLYTPEEALALGLIDELPEPDPDVPPTPPPPPPAITCPEPRTVQGRISFSGSKIGPAYPLVDGQDPTHTGVHVTASASVAPTTYTTWTAVPVTGCVNWPGWPASRDCPAGKRQRITDYTCQENTQTFNECVVSSSSLRLSEASQDWILNELSIRYPGAYLHEPFLPLGGGGCAMNVDKEHLLLKDPGYWNLYVGGRTTGTPVTSPRQFGGNVSTFEVWLKEVGIIK
jgi:hypothetical protein